MTNESDYPLTIEILEDHPCGALLEKGQTCKARYISETNSDYFVLDQNEPDEDWSICNEQARLIA